MTFDACRPAAGGNECNSLITFGAVAHVRYLMCGTCTSTLPRAEYAKVTSLARWTSIFIPRSTFEDRSPEGEWISFGWDDTYLV